MWAKHPDFIPNGVGGIVLGPTEPFVEREPPLFLRSSELIHSSCDTLQFRVFNCVLKVHDYTITEDSDDDRSDPNTDGLPEPEPSAGSSLRLWPRIYRVAGDGVSPFGEPWPTLAGHDGGVAWAMPSAA
jgi:hypothetical protein